MIEIVNWDERLHDDEYDVKWTDGNVTSGDSNKIKLKMTSYAIIMEVQKAFMQEELEKQKEELDRLESVDTNTALTEEEHTIINENIESLRNQIESLTEVYEEFSNARQRFMEIAKKALKVHEENIEQMKANSYYLEKEPEMSVDFSDYEKAQTVLEDAQNANIFSNVDSEAIKEEVNRVMAEKDSNALSDEDKDYENNGNYFVQNVTSDNFERVVSTAAKEINEELKEQEPEKMSKDDIKADLDKFLGGTTPINTDNKDKEETNPIFDQEQPIEPEYDELGVDFNSDKSIESFIKGLEDRNASLKSHGEELNSKISEVKAERTEATNKQEQAKREREEAKKRKDEVKRQIELFNSYKPKMDELRKANEEQEKLNSDKEAELKKENEALAAINSETTTIETETAAYDEETSKALEELKKLRAEFAGTGYDSGDTQMTSGGRTM